MEIFSILGDLIIALVNLDLFVDYMGAYMIVVLFFIAMHFLNNRPIEERY